jgi:SAM-dependent methyltransferase
VHEAAFRWVERCVSDFDCAGWSVLDLGGRDVNGTTRGLFGGRYVVVDIEPHPSVDVVADAALLDLDERFDVVVSTECFEHTPKGAEICAAAFRHLTDKGVFIATMAGPGRVVHNAVGGPDLPAGEWYRNVEPDELSSWLAAAGFGSWSVDQAGPDVRCWARP